MIQFVSTIVLFDCISARRIVWNITNVLVLAKYRDIGSWMYQQCVYLLGFSCVTLNECLSNFISTEAIFFHEKNFYFALHRITESIPTKLVNIVCNNSVAYLNWNVFYISITGRTAEFTFNNIVLINYLRN